MQISQKITGNIYIQTLFAILITIAIVISLGSLLFQPDQNSNLQLASIIGIGITLFIFFSFTLWKVNQQKQWVSLWAKHPALVILTFATLPILLTLLANMPVFQQIIVEELFIKWRELYLPHFMFFYFWEALIFGIAFLAHPDRKQIKWTVSYKGLLFCLLLSLGLWSTTMFINEIQLQWTIIPINYLESQSFFWPIIPLATILVPISTSYFFFYQQQKKSILQKIVLLLLFCLLPLRTICLLPAFIIGIVLLLINQNNVSFSNTVLTYSLFNLFTLILNWHWVI